MEQAAKRQDRCDEGEKQQHDAPAPPAEPEEPFSLLQELPGPLTRQLVQRHLDAKDCLALLRTSHALARAAVQHRTRQQRRALTWTWWPQEPQWSHRFSSMDTPQTRTAASLLVRWAPAELRVVLHGTTRDDIGTAISLPAALLPLFTSLRLYRMHLRPATIDSLQRCQRLHTLDVDHLTFAAAPPPAQQPARALQPLPLLRTFRYEHFGTPGGVDLEAWAARDLGALCALAVEVAASDDVEEWAAHLPNATHWDLRGDALSSEQVEVLLQPNVRHVQAHDLSLDQDHSQQHCQWETFTVGSLEELDQLLLLPSGIGRVVVTHSLTLLDVGQQQEVEALLQQWGRGRLQARVDTPPSDFCAKSWHLGREEAQGGFFELQVLSAAAVAARAALLRSMVLPQGGGPHTLALQAVWEGSSAAPLLQQLVPLLVGTRVRTLCLWFADQTGPVRGDVLSALPASIASVHVTVRSVEQAREVLLGPAATHSLRLVLLMLRGVQEQQRELHELCAARQPLVQLEVVVKD